MAITIVSRISATDVRIRKQVPLPLRGGGGGTFAPTMSMELLPSELTDLIADAACKVRTNGKTGSNLRIIIRTQHLPSSCQGEAVRWVLRCLEDRRLEYAKLCDQWYIVSNVVKSGSRK